MPFPAVRAGLTLIGATAIGAGLATGVLLAIGHPGHIPIALATAGVCLVAALAALEPVRRAGRVSLERTPPAALAGIGIRLAITLLGAIALIYGLGFEQKPTVMWTLGFYLLLLMVEVRLLVRYFQSMPTPGHRPPPPHDPTTHAVEGPKC